jgi:hypothetical protein
MPNWKVRIYDKDNKVIALWYINERTEHEAEKEARSEIEHRFPDCDDWTMTTCINPTEEAPMDFATALTVGLTACKTRFKNLHFDERDSYPILRHEIQAYLGRPMTTKELRNRQYTVPNTAINKACDAAANLAYINRVGSQGFYRSNAEAIADANLKYLRALDKIPL